MTANLRSLPFVSVLLSAFLLALTFLLALSLPLRAETRIALVVGNSGYEHVSALPNPKNDAALMARSLEGVGFRVTLLPDATLGDFRQAVSKFGQDLRAAGPDATGLFYYAGHGVQSFGSNYLLPVDAALTDAADLDLVAVEAQSVLRQMNSARNKTNIVILDACRNNPFEAIAGIDDNGLAEMKAPTGTFLAYATAPGAVALDGLDQNSPFTEALARELPDPGVAIEQMFKRVRVAVLQTTGGLQTPWDTSSLTSDFTFAAAPKVDAVAQAEDELWGRVGASRDPVQIMLYMRAYPTGRHADDALSLLAAVMAEQQKKPGAGDTKMASRAPGPTAAEQADFDAAQAAASVEDWNAFLAAHPDSVFREAAESELAAAAAKAGTDTTPQPAQPQDLTADIFFDQPLTQGGPDVAGKSIAQLIAGSPTHPPIEGLPEAVWKGKACANCHAWTKPDLCKQGTFYVSQGTTDSFGALHPYGGQLRQVLKVWADQGCR